MLRVGSMVVMSPQESLFSHYPCPITATPTIATPTHLLLKSLKRRGSGDAFPQELPTKKPAPTDHTLFSASPPPANEGPSLGTLFPELLSLIFAHLEPLDKSRLALTCTYFNQVLKNRQIWKGTEARLNLRPNQAPTFASLHQRGIHAVQVLSLKRSLRELSSGLGRTLTHLKLSGCYNVTDYSLASLQPLPSLTTLDLSLCKQITDAGLVHILGKAGSLVTLDLGGCCSLTDRAALLIAYGLRGLKTLDLRSCYNLTDKAAAYLAGEVYITDRAEIKTYNFLAKIGLIDCKLCARAKKAIEKEREKSACLKNGGSKVPTHSGVPGAKASGSGSRVESLPKIDNTTSFGMLSLETLVLQDCQKISDSALASISNLKSLSSLNLSFCVNVTDNGLKHLRELGALRELNLRSCDNISDVGFLALRDCLRLEVLDVSFCDKIGLLPPSVCRNLKSLSVSACEVDDEALIGAGEMGALDTLNLGQCSRVTDKGLLAVVEKAKNLKYMDLYGCSNISTKGVECLKGMKNLKHVNLGLWKV